MIYSTVQENEFNYRLYAWQEILPLYFAANQVNYMLDTVHIILKC